MKRLRKEKFPESLAVLGCLGFLGLVMIACLVGIILGFDPGTQFLSSELFSPPASRLTRLTIQVKTVPGFPGEGNGQVRATSQAEETLKKRLSALPEATIQRSDDGTLLVELPEQQATSWIIRELIRPGCLKFKRYIQGNPTETGLDFYDLESAEATQDGGGQWVVSVRFNSAGKEELRKLTGEMAGKNEALGIYVDDELVSAPVVAEPITGGEAVISGGFTPEEARVAAAILNTGPLPPTLQLIVTSKSP